MAETKLGALQETPGLRDAVHVAVVSIEAGQPLKRGTRCILKWDGDKRIAVKPKADERPIGVVDPFLRELQVERGQAFLMWLWPGTITGLQHVWTHPLFDGGKEAGPAEMRMRQLALTLGLTYEAMLDDADRFQTTGDPVIQWKWESLPQYDGFWADYALVTGRKPTRTESWDRFFSCGGCSGG